MKDEQEQQDEYPDYGHNSQEWGMYVRVVAASLIGVGLILWGAGNVKTPDQFWNVFILGSVTWLILVAAWVQIGVYQRQWRVMRDGLEKTQMLIRQANRSQQTFINTERAYLGIESISLISPLSPTEDPRVKIVILNAGRTPARSIQAQIQPLVIKGPHPMQLLREYHPQKPRPGEVFGRIGILAAGKSSITPEIAAGGLCDMPEWKEALPEIEQGKIPFYVRGSILFMDFENTYRQFRFIAFYNWEAKNEFVECGMMEMLAVVIPYTGDDRKRKTAEHENKGKKPN